MDDEEPQEWTEADRNVTWLLEPDVFQHNIGELVAAIEAAGEVVVYQRHPPAQGRSSTDVFVAYGSCEYVRRVADTEVMYPGVFVGPQFDCTHYYPKLGTFLLNSDYFMLPYGELFRKRADLFPDGPRSPALFCRPNGWNKSFAGRMIRPDSLKEDIDWIGFYGLEPDALVVLAPEKEIVAEWRVIVANSTAAASCQYDPKKHAGISAGAPESVLSGVDEMIRTWQPASVYAIDVCLNREGQVKLLELNPFNSCDLYLCDRKKVVEYVSPAARAANPL